MSTCTGSAPTLRISAALSSPRADDRTRCPAGIKARNAARPNTPVPPTTKMVINIHSPFLSFFRRLPPVRCSDRDQSRAMNAVRAKFLSRGFAFKFEITANQRVRRGIVPQWGRTWLFKLGNDALRQNFAQFHTPLVERIDLPDRTLCKDAVLVNRYEFAQHFRRQAPRQYNVRGAVPLKSSMRHQSLGSALGANLFRGLAES